MKRSVNYLVVLTLSILLSQSMGLSYSDNNTTTLCSRSDEEFLSKFTQQMQSLIDSNAKLHSLIAKLNSQMGIVNVRLDQLEQSISAQDSNCCIEYPSNCDEIPMSKRANGIFEIQVDLFDTQPFLVPCNETTQGGGWTVIQRRVGDSIDFNRDWAGYKVGFGNLESDFFIGLDKLHALTNASPQELLIILSDFDGDTRYAKYDAFAIGNEHEDYKMTVLGQFSGDAGDSLTYHSGQRFSTKDRDNDSSSAIHCAAVSEAGWWFNACILANLNGVYASKYQSTNIFWYYFHLYDRLSYVQMMIRPKRN